MNGGTVDESHVFDDWKTYFEIPHWMHLSFLSYDEEGKKAFGAHEQKAGEYIKLDDIISQYNIDETPFVVGYFSTARFTIPWNAERSIYRS